MTATLAVARRAINLVMLVALLVLLGLAAAAHLAPVAGRQLIVIGGRSMEPAIPLGSAVLVGRREPAEICVGDVVTLRHPNGVLVTHRVTRVVAEDTRRFETKGDASLSPDPVLAEAPSVVGVVDLTIPLAGFLLALLATPTGVLSLAALIVAGWLIEEVEDERRLRAGAPTADDGGLSGAPA